MADKSRPLMDQVPPDIWREISELLNPIDVIALGETCKALHEATAERTLWLNLLKAVCMEYDLFLHSYPIDEMSVAQLRRAALGPHLWIQRVHKHAVSPNVHFPDLGTSTNVLRPVSTIPFCGRLNSALWFKHLIPGGRFVITCDKGESQGTDILELWDLGFAGKRPLLQPLLLASQDIGHPPVHCSLTWDCSNLDTETLAVAVGTTDSSGHRGCISVFIISPHRPNPSFNRLPPDMSMEFLSPNTICYPSAFNLRGDKVLAQYANVIVVWDFIRGLPQLRDVLYWIAPCRDHPSTNQSGDATGQTHIVGCTALDYAGGVVASCTATGRFIVNLAYELVGGESMALVDYMA
ncbi:hypothetical protein D9611_010407 [Ephemerocybe angulata]|uniref:F-box domain-containing protein n=1 Tax=Ephemerocybe angulata TaxID=980116 RepID=A0A8H5BVH0_9AGAR|nr:hypothetical protein D9611_010407 [Tulosesus angulatus]